MTGAPTAGTARLDIASVPKHQPLNSLGARLQTFDQSILRVVYFAMELGSSLLSIAIGSTLIAVSLTYCCPSIVGGLLIVGILGAIFKLTTLGIGASIVQNLQLTRKDSSLQAMNIRLLAQQSEKADRLMLIATLLAFAPGILGFMIFRSFAGAGISLFFLPLGYGLWAWARIKRQRAWEGLAIVCGIEAKYPRLRIISRDSLVAFFVLSAVVLPIIPLWGSFCAIGVLFVAAGSRFPLELAYLRAFLTRARARKGEVTPI